MPVEKIIIEVGKNDKELDSILDKLVKAKKLSKEQADQFRNDSKSFQEAAKKREKLLQEEIQDLTELKLRKRQAFSTEEIERYNKRIEESQRRIRALEGETRNLHASTSKIEGLMRNVGGVIAAAFTIDKITQFTIESVKLAAKAEGIKRAFDKLDQPGLLGNLQRATRGTVNSIELMQSAVRANNFRLPLEDLAKYFEFATARAIETGESVDYLVNSIIDGIGRKSTLVLDNLGISASELQQELKKTGDFGQAAGNIITRELELTGDVADTTEIKIKRMTVAWEEFQAKTGERVIDFLFFDKQADQIDKITDAQQRLTEILNEGGVENEDYARKLRFVIQESKKEFDAIVAQSGGLDRNNKLRTENIARVLLEKDAIKELLGAYDVFQEQQKDAATLNAGKLLVERIQEAEKALGRQVNQADKNLASLNKETAAVSELLKVYDQFLLMLDSGATTREALLNIYKKEFKLYEDQNKALREQRELKERITEVNERIISQAREELNFGPQESDLERAERIGDQILNQALENDAKFADQFDRAQEDIDEKERKAAEVERQRQQDAFDFEKELNEKRFDLADSLVSAFISLNQENAEAQKGLLLFEKLIAIFRVVINGQAAAMRARAELGAIAGEVAAQRINALTALSVVTIAAQTIPTLALKEGVIDLQGPGTSTSDSIHARLSKGESVMTAKETAKHKEDLKAMRAKNWDTHIFHNYQLPFLKDFIIKNNINNEFNDRNLLDSQYRMRQELKGLRADLKKTRKHQLSVR